MKALITGFEAFGGAAANPSAEIAARLAQIAPPAPLDTIESVVLPTVYQEAARHVREALAKSQPDLVVMFGLAARADRYRLERFAVNVADSPDPDNAGSILAGEPVVGSGPAAYRSGLDVAAIAARCAGHGPSVSNHAGTFVCNYAYFTVLHEIAVAGAATQALFVHVPWTLPVGLADDLTRSPVERHLETARGLLAAIGDVMPTGGSAA
jgi:pyroglutamyl-peptidase